MTDVTAHEPDVTDDAAGEELVDLVELKGATFRVSDDVARMALMKFGKMAEVDQSMLDISSLAAVYDLLEQCIHATDWRRFEQHALDTKADEQELLEVVGKVFVILDGRPTKRSSGSSDGPPTTATSSTDDSSSLATVRSIDRFNAQGRPDLALLVRRAEEARSSA